MMIKYWSGGEEFEIERKRVVFTDRSRIELRKSCPRAWWLNYHSGPAYRGVESFRKSEDLISGSGVHEGLHWKVAQRAWGESQAVDAPMMAYQYVMDRFESGELLIQGDERLSELVPEVARMLAEEQAWIAYAAVWTFDRRHLEPLLEEYEILTLEEEVPWVLGWVDEGEGERPIVMLSRLDGVARSKRDGKLRVIEYKTKKDWDRETADDLPLKEQGAAAMLACYNRYGQLPSGVIYFYFLKGDKRKDKEISYDRYMTSLVRPYHRKDGGDEVVDFAWSYDYEKPDGSAGKLGPKWERVDVWGEGQIGVEAWLEMVDSGQVQSQMGRDWLDEVVATPELVVWSPEQLEEWRLGALHNERQWLLYQDGPAETEQRWMPEIYKRSEACRTFRQPCKYRKVCWEDQRIENLVAIGKFKVREPNHPIEFADAANEVVGTMVVEQSMEDRYEA